MIFVRRLAVVVFTAVLLLLLFRLRPTNYHDTIQNLSQSVGLGEYLEDEDDGSVTYPVNGQVHQQEFPSLSQDGGQRENGTSSKPLITSPYAPGVLKPTGENYSRAFITGHLTSESVAWLDSYLHGDPLLTPYIYIVDDVTAPLHTPMNKGHEVMYYLTHIIDNYDSLSDINIFMHPHKIAWHTPELLNHDASEVLKRLSSERVVREGYMNLRCHWDPGCPERIYPGRTLKDNSKAEERAIARAWAEMFSGDDIPDALGAPCCAQFAVSRERIRSIPKAKFEKYRNWLIHTQEDDWISGRVFEYLWQKIFADVAKLCPNARVCYCDGYGICFTSSEVYNEWFQGYHYWLKATEELEAWEKKAAVIQDLGDLSNVNVEGMRLEIPLAGRDFELKKEIADRHAMLVRLRTEAVNNGTNLETRALIAGRMGMPSNWY